MGVLFSRRGRCGHRAHVAQRRDFLGAQHGERARARDLAAMCAVASGLLSACAA
jgi:hypothetical protein